MRPHLLCKKTLALVTPLVLLFGCSSLTPSAESDLAPVSTHKMMLSDPTTRGLVQIPQLEEYLNEVMQKILRVAEPSQIAGKTFHVYIAATAGSWMSSRLLLITLILPTV